MKANGVRTHPIDGHFEVHRVIDWGLVHVYDIVHVSVSFCENRPYHIKDLECLGLNFTWMALCLVGGHAMRKPDLFHEARDGHQCSMLGLLTQLRN